MARKTAEEALTAQQQLRGKAEVAPAEALERTLAHTQPLGERGHVGDRRIAQRGLAGEDLRLLRRGPVRVLHQVVVDADGDPVVIAIGALHDPLNRCEEGKGFVNRTIDRTIAQVIGRVRHELRPPRRLQPEPPDSRAGDAKIDALAGRAVGHEWPLPDQLAGTDARERRRPFGEAQCGPLRMEAVSHLNAGRAVDGGCVECCKVGLERFRQTVKAH